MVKDILAAFLNGVAFGLLSLPITAGAIVGIIAGGFIRGFKVGKELVDYVINFGFVKTANR